MHRLSLITLVLILTCWWPLIGTVPWPLAPLIWLGALWLPGAVFCLPKPSGSSFDRWWLPLGLGPVVFGLGICLGRFAGIPLDLSASLTITAAGLALVWRVHQGKHDTAATTVDVSGRTRDFLSQPWVLPAAMGILVFLLGVLPSLSHEPLRLRDDARLHLPIIQRILAGSFPPENPFLAEMPLAYFWFYHATLAGVARLSGLTLDLIPALFNMQALLVLLLALDRVGRRFSLCPLARAATLAFLGLGLLHISPGRQVGGGNKGENQDKPDHGLIPDQSGQTGSRHRG